MIIIIIIIIIVRVCTEIRVSYNFFIHFVFILYSSIFRKQQHFSIQLLVLLTIAASVCCLCAQISNYLITEKCHSVWKNVPANKYKIRIKKNRRNRNVTICHVGHWDTLLLQNNFNALCYKHNERNTANAAIFQK